MRRMKKGELHLHTTYSDGHITAEDINNCGLDFIAITDHDTVEGFLSVKEQLTNGLELIPGIEFSTKHRGKGIHVLAYFFNYNNPEFLEELEYYRQKRVNRANKNFGILHELGYAVDYSKINKNGTIGKPNIADSIFALPENDELLVKNRINSVDDFIDLYLEKGKPAYVPVEKIPLEKIRHYCNGPLVLAHPAVDLDRGSDDWIIRDLRDKYDLRGLEVFTRRHNPEETAYYYGLARQLGLIPSRGSDAHHRERIGLYAADYSLVNELRKIKV
ncbi:PHP domain-containing protein [Candidatus Woesearchaeota archaeon]|nr:PHP domain-containing protein [Candidatus Woesearchaeota archaeon]